MDIVNGSIESDIFLSKAMSGLNSNFSRILGCILGHILLVVTGAVLAADIRSTPHNLTRMGLNVTAEEVCVFCHTPLQAAGVAGRSVTSSVPTWQSALPVTFTFVIYDDIGRLQFGDKPAVGSQSIACMSCHDANQAFSVMAAAYDHPFGVPYRGYFRGREPTVAELAAVGDAPAVKGRFVSSFEEFKLPSQGVVDSRSVWWVSSSGLTPVRAREDLPLYARQAETGEVPYVECSSCHDPHVANKLFLRVTADGSRLCLTCHDK